MTCNHSFLFKSFCCCGWCLQSVTSDRVCNQLFFILLYSLKSQLPLVDVWPVEQLAAGCKQLLVQPVKADLRVREDDHARKLTEWCDFLPERRKKNHVSAHPVSANIRWANQPANPQSHISSLPPQPFSLWQEETLVTPLLRLLS